MEPATRSDLMHVRDEIGVLSKMATAFLIPDNHLGQATVSSVAVTHEVAQMGRRAIACVDARGPQPPRLPPRSTYGMHMTLGESRCSGAG